MQLTSATTAYCTKQRLRSRTLSHNATRFAHFCGDMEVCEITDSVIEHFRKLALESALSAWTIEKTITDVLTVLHASQVMTAAGTRLRLPRPIPRPVALTDIAAAWESAAPWLRQWMAIAYWTGLRLADSLRLQLSLSGNPPDTLQLHASKTGHLHQWPVPAWLKTHLAPRSLPFGKPNDHAMQLVRTCLTCASRDSVSADFCPKQLRQRALTEWSKANGMAGAILHGSGLSGVMRHYVDPLSVLESAAPRVRIPACFGDCQTQGSEDALLSHFRRLDPAAQGLISGTAERLATG